MASQKALAMKAWKHASGVESALKDLMTGQTFPLYDSIENLIKQFRIACEATIFHDFEYAVTQTVEGRLWNAHVLINGRYRKMLEGFRKPDKKHFVVERRKLEKHYVDFIKTSQFFYKGYIQRLACHFGGLPGLRRVAHRLTLELLSADTPIEVEPELEGLIEASCHSSLLRLGDLSRYRNQVRTKDRSWEAALGYYALANDLCPDKGSAHNQMAVIALADGDHLNAVYHLFRAFAVKEGHELASGNLNVEFKKILTAGKQPKGKTDSLSNLVWWFVLLHARFHEGQQFSTRKEMENEVLSRVTVLLKGPAFGDVLEKLVIINIAAEDFAAKRLKDEEKTAEMMNSYFFCVEFNIRMLHVLLQVLSSELDEDHSGEELPKGPGEADITSIREKISAPARRILPVLRQYSTWLSYKTQVILACATQLAIKFYSQEMWNMYAIVLTKLVNLFPIGELPTVKYLLEEDEATIGFEPLRNSEVPVECDLFTDLDGVAKVRTTDAGIQRSHPNIEMQARIRDIILTAACLESKKVIPVSLNRTEHGQHVFTYTQDDMLISSPHSSSNEDGQLPNGSSRDGRVATTATFTSDKTSGWSRMDKDQSSTTESMDHDLSRMVDDLVEPQNSESAAPDETSYGMHSRTANEVFAAIPSGSYEPRQHSTPKMLPSLTGYYGSIFTPTQNELQASSPRTNGGRQVSPYSLSTKEDRLAAAHALDQMTGYCAAPRRSGSSVRNTSGPLSGTPQQPVNQILQQSLQQQYMGFSSAFTDSSSLYGNSTHMRNRLSVGSAKNAPNGNSTFYAGASDFDRTTMLQSSLWNGSEANNGRQYMQTPPGGQGG